MSKENESQSKVKPSGGEGDREADRRFREKTKRFVEEHQDGDLDPSAQARPDDDDTTRDAEKAESRAEERAREKDPEVVRDYEKPTR